MRFRNFLRGDTLVEVMFSVGIFGLVAVSAISLMNKGLYSAQGALEINMARTEIDAQAEALRFIHNAYVSEQDASTEIYTKLWKELVAPENVYTPTEAAAAGFFENYNDVPCGSIYYKDDGTSNLPSKSFVINPRFLNSETIKEQLESHSGDISNIIIKNVGSDIKLTPSATYPRLVYGNTASNEENEDGSLSDMNTNTNSELYKNADFYAAEGIWVTVVAEGDTVSGADAEFVPDFYDFYIRTCWDTAGGGRGDSHSSSTISTTIRLYNPDAITLECIVQTEGQTCAPAALEQSGIFFVMTWNTSNRDIDSHLIGPNNGLPTPTSYHVYFGHKFDGENKTHEYILADGTRQVVDGYTLQLDVDALGTPNYNYAHDCNTTRSDCPYSADGYVEVIAIRSLYSSNFHYYIYDWSGQGLPNRKLQVRAYVGYAANGVGEWPRYNTPFFNCYYDKTSATDTCSKGRSGSGGRYWDVANIIVEGSGLITTELINNGQGSAPTN